MTEMKTLTCEVCGSSFQHPKQRGRPPKTCLEHRGKSSITTASKVPPAARERLKASDRPILKLEEIEAELPKRSRGGASIYVCGWCSGAPRSSDREAAHFRCPGTGCACANVEHKPTAAIRRQQSQCNYMTVEECARRDPGLVEVSSG